MPTSEPLTVRRELEHEQDPRCRVLQEDYLKLIRQLGSREAITRRFFLVFEYEPLPGTKRGHEEEDAIASLQTAARTAANYLRQCGNEVISSENEDDATAEILYNILCRRASSEPFYQRVKSVLADYMASGRDINAIPVNEFYAPDSIDLILATMLTAEIDFIVRGLDNTARSVVASRKAAKGVYYTNKNGQIILNVTGTVIVTEEASIEGYTIDPNTRTQTVEVHTNDTQTLTFFNDPVGGLELIKVNAAKPSERIPNTTFEIRKVDGAMVDTVTTGKTGRAFSPLEDGAYYAVEIEAAEGFHLDDTPHYFEVKGGKTTTLTVKNKALSGILIHKIDSTTGEGIYGVTFLLYDGNKNPMGQYESDQDGYVYITDLEKSGRYYIRELENEGYHVDKQLKTVYVTAGKTIEIEWENEPVTGQIQIYKYAAEYNEVTGTAPGTPLKGAVYEIVNARSGKVLDYITTDARGVAASKPLPLTRYQIREVTAPVYWQVDTTVQDVTLEYAGQIIKLSAYDKAAKLGASITKRGNSEVLAGSQMRYDLSIANTSNVDLQNFYWHDRIPTDIANATTLSTGTYSARLTYRILYKTNYNASYQVLASNLLSSNNYSFALNAIPMQAGEVVTDIYFDFGTVPVGFQSVTNPTLSVMVKGTAVNGYQMVNRADVGGKYQGTWQTAQASWVTIIRSLFGVPTLPKTGY